AEVVVDALCRAVDELPRGPVVRFLFRIGHEPVLPELISDHLEAVPAPADDREVAPDGMLALEVVVVDADHREERDESGRETSDWTHVVPAEPPGEERASQDSGQESALLEAELPHCQLQREGEHCSKNADLQTTEMPSRQTGDQCAGEEGVMMFT